MLGQREMVLQQRGMVLQQQEMVLQQREMVLQQQEMVLQQREMVLQQRGMVLQQREFGVHTVNPFKTFILSYFSMLTSAKYRNVILQSLAGFISF